MNGNQIKDEMLVRGISPTVIDLFMEFHAAKPGVWQAFKETARKCIAQGYQFLNAREVMKHAMELSFERNDTLSPNVTTLISIGNLYAIVFEATEKMPGLFELDLPKPEVTFS